MLGVHGFAHGVGAKSAAACVGRFAQPRPRGQAPPPACLARSMPA
eukprot:CAMPEP_0179314338 /NCGR_PEP_ID=MMETSP0797-20121207/54382_1 /TAXON_ID=47934 /ORGANISM="Dinophysis acuminata, Strain DAEP01" /LENGTH=44 /DNA_ID= /DNA_START= /DNA_END= /DNA_ORIENTATION=